MLAQENKFSVFKTNPDDIQVDQSLRPKSFSDFIGQDKLKSSLKIAMKAANERKESLEHILFSGPPGLGKTSLSHLIAKEQNKNIKITSGPALERLGDLAAILTSLEEGDILFIDEIHRLNRLVEEAFYPALEEFALDIILGKGPGAKTLRLDLPKFTLIGATTRPSLLSSPLRDRFGFHYQLNFYQKEEIGDIIKRSAKILSLKINDDAVREIADRSRSTPRIANRLLKRVRDFAQVKKRSVDAELVHEALSLFEVDKLGLTTNDRRLLNILIDKFNGGPVGLKTLSIALNEEIASLEDLYEPYLLQIGFLERTSRGRKASGLAYKYLEKEKTV